MSRASEIDPMKKVRGIGHDKDGKMKPVEFEVSILDEILYTLRPRLFDRNETPRQRVEAVKKAKKQIQTLIIDKAVLETAKAYGACKKCYGKGYHTEHQVTVGGHRAYGKKVRLAMNYCICDRGKQLEKLLKGSSDE